MLNKFVDHFYMRYSECLQFFICKILPFSNFVSNAAVMDRVVENCRGPYHWKKTPVNWLQCPMTDDRLVKIVMMGAVGDSRLQGRPPSRWSDNMIDITEWCNCTFPETIRLAESRQEELLCKKINDIVGFNGLSRHEPQEERFRRSVDLQIMWWSWYYFALLTRTLQLHCKVPLLS